MDVAFGGFAQTPPTNGRSPVSPLRRLMAPGRHFLRTWVRAETVPYGVTGAGQPTADSARRRGLSGLRPWVPSSATRPIMRSHQASASSSDRGTHPPDAAVTAAIMAALLASES